MQRFILKFLFLTVLIGAISTASAQNLLTPHPLDIRSGQAHLLNPAITSYQHNMIQLGMRIYHLGFIDGSAARFRLNYFSLVLPRILPAELAFAAHVQSLSMPIYNQSYVSVAVSRRYRHLFSVGLKAGMLSKSYDRNEFNLVDPDDPVFKDQKGFTRLDLGAGVTFWPMPAVSISLSSDHLNVPNVALGPRAFRLRVENHLALAYHFGNVQTALITQRDQQNWRAGGFVQMDDPARGFLRLGYDKLGVQMEGRLKLYGSVSLNYSLNYPTADLRGETSGSHEFGLVFEFDRLFQLPKLEQPPEFRYAFGTPAAYEPSGPRAYIRAENDVLEITAKRLQRIIAADVPVQALASLSGYDLGIFDSSFVAPTLPLNLAPFVNADTSAKLTGLYSNAYWHSLRQLSESVTQQPISQATIVAGPFANPRAVALRNYLLQSAPLGMSHIQMGQPQFANRLDSLRFHRRASNRIIVPREEVTVLNPSAAIFHITTANFSSLPVRWQLTVEKETGGTVWKMEGQGRIPQQLVWNWKDNNGKLLAPGYYRYFITWQAAGDVTFSSHEQKFYVKKFQRTVTIHVRRKFDGLQQPADEVKMILNR